MPKGHAGTVAEYLAQLPQDRRKVVASTRALVKGHLPKGYKEEMNWGAITWCIPLSQYPDTYNKQPLCYAALAAQKNYVSLYLMMAYGDPKRYSLDDIPVDAVASLIESHTPAQWIAIYEKSRR